MLAQPPPPLPGNVLHREESAYTRLEVVDAGDRVGLRTEHRTGTMYSAVMKDGSLPPFRIYNLFAVPALGVGSGRGLLLGAGAGTLPRIHGMLNPGIRFVGVEIDPRVIAVGWQFFGLGSVGNLDRVVVVDARPFLRGDTSRYDLIEMDAFRTSEIPFYLVTREFFELTKERLAERGIFTMNVYDPTPGRVVVTTIANTMAAVYRESYLVPAGSGSFLLVGCMHAPEIPLVSAVRDPRLAELVGYYRVAFVKVGYSPRAPIFTDDLAPVEALYEWR